MRDRRATEKVDRVSYVSGGEVEYVVGDEDWRSQKVLPVSNYERVGWFIRIEKIVTKKGSL